uniref:Prefoldin subunit 1 n=1 Tax=Neobodo designis TaxID=312471 RepID=A0A7S1W445_NEODS|mmetsp:Transcript_51774/g.159537  ORF Transcript_51774/g.159537 Transcript_51774/m.159537 type:complete len:146 (+) Transcript_51774:51-488(+)|eukprot:CAMPEP_0174855678 /NCGR_PEP_ID=MMETSP1114-20130205/33933_1 /TAXON_ID=312471 /ORGANISM="Neobodo designis, Strain CCAP 1951/1" /LENGTH=145 /DNA_ID=CAMNT_0016090427 /DNA_START=50 /DNA_END=487 /DNA_ORIENTATION=+
MSSASIAVAQAEMQEKEKVILEQQQKCEMIRNKVVQLANHQKALDMEKRRCAITCKELATVGADRPVYKGLGRVFIKVPATKLAEDHESRAAMCTSESARVSEENRKISAVLQQEEERLNQLATDFMAHGQMLQQAQQRAAQQQK